MRVLVRVPATSANLGPGFDALGLALGILYAAWLMNHAFGQYSMSGRLGDSIRDPETTAKLDGAVRSLGDALGTTFSDLGERVRKHLGGSREG